MTAAISTSSAASTSRSRSRSRFPLIMNAGGSGVGRHFAAKHCDMIFIHIKGMDVEAARRDVDEVRTLARKEYGREIQVWANCYCVIGDTDEEALKFRDWYVRDKGDWQAVDNLVRVMGLQSGVLPKEALEGSEVSFHRGLGRLSAGRLAVADRRRDRQAGRRRPRRRIAVVAAL